MRTRSRSRTTTKKRPMGRRVPPAELIGRRLPRHRPPTHPGEMLRDEFLEPLGVTALELAHRLGVSFPRLNEIIRRKRAASAWSAQAVPVLVRERPSKTRTAGSW